MSSRLGLTPGVRRVIEVLRRDVPRPHELPTPDAKWSLDKLLVWTTPRGWCCPLGLHPLASVPRPGVYAHCPIPGLLPPDIGEFGEWWDSRRCSPAAAVEAVWGPAS
jgi:hypothetical protein